ncbi:MAG: K+-transporting ATPase, c chain, partial [Phenylobacterium sp.]|nr:K+-transporting ATPase, c chain [Phenylobacterium sp.]
EQVRKIISDHVGAPTLGFLGQPHVNVLMTNRALDTAAPKSTPKAS